ncbi:MAG: ABC transporter permease [Fimbriimonadaceae bacterium]|nr:ABC transporter permease [Fimbriimonadaceae bacterium]
MIESVLRRSTLRTVRRFAMFQQIGLVLVILVLCAVLTRFSGTHTDRITGQTVSNFLNPNSLTQIFTETSFIGIMAVGVTLVMLSGGIDLSVGSIYALAGVTAGMVMRQNGLDAPLVALGLSLAVGLGCGLLNGLMVANLHVHPFIITLGAMWVYRGFAFVASKAESILLPAPVTAFAKATWASGAPTLVPTAALGLITLVGAVTMARTVFGRHVIALGSNPDAARYSGLRIPNLLTGVYVLAGATAGISAFLGAAYYGSASSGDGDGYELYVIASAVVGGVSLNGGRGSVVGAFLGALLIVLIRTGIRVLKLDQNYEWIIIGVAIIVAVVLDRLSTHWVQRNLDAGRATAA